MRANRRVRKALGDPPTPIPPAQEAAHALAFAARVVNEVTRQALGFERCCITASAVMVEVLDRLGLLGARAHGVRLFLLEPAILAEALEGRRDFSAESRAYSLGTDADEWDGHVVVEVHGWLVDASLRQARGPFRGAMVPDVAVVPMGRAIEVPEMAVWTSAQLPTGTWMLFSQRPGYRFREDAYWTDSNLVERLADRATPVVAAEWDRLGVQSLRSPTGAELPRLRAGAAAPPIGRQPETRTDARSASTGTPRARSARGLQGRGGSSGLRP